MRRSDLRRDRSRNAMTRRCTLHSRFGMRVAGSADRRAPLVRGPSRRVARISCSEEVLGWAVDFFDAVESSDVEAVKALLVGGADPNAADRRRRTAVGLASTLPSTSVLQLLLDHGASPDAKDACGMTALMSAVKIDQAEAVVLLLRAGADSHATDFSGHTVLWHSRRREVNFAVGLVKGLHGTVFLPRFRRTRSARLIDRAIAAKA